MQAERAGRFDWYVLERGPVQFRVEIRRRRTAASRGVTECLQADHSRLDAILTEAATFAESGAFVNALQLFAEFACGIDHHIRAEEEVLFSVFEQATGIVAGPTQVMRAEHVQIRQLIADVRGALGVHDGVTAARIVPVLRELLSSHNFKEERVLYPMTDRAIEGALERDEIVCRLQAV
jgi:hemerythrin-like domain-containing protein